MRLVITGASGLLGATLSLIARDRHEVVALSREVPLGGADIDARQLDLRDADAVDALVRAAKPDAVIHSAALTDVDRCEREPDAAEEHNVRASANVARAARRAGARFLYVSTDSVFDGARGDYIETDVTNPVNHYARSKLAGEEAVTREHSEAVIARTNIYGWNARPNKRSLAEWALARFRDGASVPGWTDVWFTPLFTADASDLMLSLIERNLTGVYHVGGADRCSKFDFARAVADAWGLPSRVDPSSINDAHLAAPRPLDTSMNSRKLSSALGHPLPGLRAGLERMREWESSKLAELRALVGIPATVLEQSRVP